MKNILAKTLAAMLSLSLCPGGAFSGQNLNAPLSAAEAGLPHIEVPTPNLDWADRVLRTAHRQVPGPDLSWADKALDPGRLQSIDAIMTNFTAQGPSTPLEDGHALMADLEQAMQSALSFTVEQTANPTPAPRAAALPGLKPTSSPPPSAPKTSSAGTVLFTGAMLGLLGLTVLHGRVAPTAPRPPTANHADSLTIATVVENDHFKNPGSPYRKFSHFRFESSGPNRETVYGITEDGRRLYITHARSLEDFLNRAAKIKSSKPGKTSKTQKKAPSKRR